MPAEVRARKGSDLCECGHDHLMAFGSGHVRTEACREYFHSCACLRYEPLPDATLATEDRPDE